MIYVHFGPRLGELLEQEKGTHVKHTYGYASVCFEGFAEACRGVIIAAQLVPCWPAICRLLFHNWQQSSITERTPNIGQPRNL